MHPAISQGRQDYDELQTVIDQQAQNLADYLQARKSDDIADPSAVEIADGLAVHLRYGSSISKIIERQRPNEPTAITKYRQEAREDTTTSFTNRIISFTSRVFERDAWRVDSNRVEDADLVAYVEGLPIYASFYNFLDKHLKPMMFCDPNAWVVAVSRVAAPDLGDDQLPEPVPMLIPSNMVCYQADSLLVVASSEKSLVYNGKKEEYSGEVYWAFTDFATFKAKQEGKKQDRKFAVETWEMHNSGVMPAIQLGGDVAPNPETMVFDTRELYYSFLQPSMPFLNKYASLESDEQAHYLLHIYMQRYEAKMDCNRCKGAGVINAPYGDEHANCPSCNGTGIEPAGNTFSVLQVEPDVNGAVGAPAGYISPPTNIIENISKKLDYLMRQAFGAVGLEFLVHNDAERQTEGAKLLDRDEAKAFLSKVASRLQVVANFLLEQMNFLRYHVALGDAVSENYVRLIAQETYGVETLENAAAALELASTTGLHSEMVKQLMLNYAKQQLGERSIEYARLETVVMLDNTFGMSADDLLQAVTDEILTESEIRFAKKLPSLVDAVLEDDPAFLKMPMSKRKEMLEAEFESE